MRISIHQPQYFPWLGYFDKIATVDVFVLLDNVPYSKNYFYNRNRIKIKGGWTWITVPVITKGRMGQLIKDVEIDNKWLWRDKHLKSIYLAYKKAPYFDIYFSGVEDILKREWFLLAELCEETIKFIMMAFNIHTPIYKASQLGVSGSKEDLLIQICKTLRAEEYLSGRDGRNYLNLDKWHKAGIKVFFQDFKNPKYPQLHGDFLPQMSALDFLFNCGENSLKILLDENGEKVDYLLK
ncbi:MAG TPA: WbqC family protein [Victivallales bacterium]|nr:WbqC family protein [Victivallales bacterium]